MKDIEIQQDQFTLKLKQVQEAFKSAHQEKKKKMQNMANSVSLSFKPTLVSHNSKKQSTENANNMLQNFIS